MNLKYIIQIYIEKIVNYLDKTTLKRTAQATLKENHLNPVKTSFKPNVLRFLFAVHIYY